MAGTMLALATAVVFLMQQEVSADVCTDNMIYMDLCVQWKGMCQQSKFLQDKCPRTCGTCAPVNCTWADWGNFTQCTESCGGGFKTRSRVIASPPLYGGAACEGDAFESVVCNEQPCPKNCEWNTFGDWSECSASCGGGNQHRERTKKQEAEFGGQNCTGGAREVTPCNTHNCAVNCEYDDWGNFTTCSKTCDGGTQFRTRGIKLAAAFGGTECSGDTKEEQSCNTQNCPIDCEWDEWSEWDTCSLTCGGGMTARVRNIKVYPQFGGQICQGQAAEMNVCNNQTCPRDCQWGPFGAFSECSEPCGPGLKNRTRVKVVEGDPGGRNCTGPSVQEVSCNLRKCGVDCKWDVWGAWSTCTKTCGGGEETRERKIKEREAFGGAPCVGNTTQTRPCAMNPCPVPVDCEWDDYGNWTQCSKSCGGGTQIRTREIKTQARNGGARCDGTNTDLQLCNEFPCPINCLWNDYSAWSECNKDCGGGTKHRTRTVYQQAQFGGEPCEGGEKEEVACNENPCAVNCLWNEFGEWSNCTELCDGGTQTRVRTIKQEAAYGGLTCSGYATESKNCNEQPCQRDCAWAPFAEWTPCSKSCGTGAQTRSRIQLQSAANGGHDCEGLGTESRNCNTQPCPISCVWSPFSAWTPCSQKCGGGYQMRTRTVTTKAEYGGKACVGCATDSRACNAEPCAANCKWAPWHAWSECTATCGGGVQNRTRAVLQAASNGGKDCQGPAAQFRDCNTAKCPVDCKWSPWGQWDVCTRTCGGGMQARSRTIVEQERHGGKPCEGDPQEMQGCNMQACPICKDSPRYARFCPAWTIYCSNSEFVKGCCKKSCRLC